MKGFIVIYIFRKEMKKWKSVLWLVLAALAITSLSMVVMRRPSPGDAIVASVNGEDITAKQYGRALNGIKMQIEAYKRYASSYGISVDFFLSFAGLNNPEQAAIDKCVKDELLNKQTDLFNIDLDSDYFSEKLAKTLPAQLKDASGNINMDAYKFYVNKMLSSISEYEDSQEAELKRELLNNVIQRSLYIPEDELRNIFYNQNYKKSFEAVEFKFNDFMQEAKKTSIDEKELKNYFGQNKEKYRIPEKRNAQYWVISAKEYAKNIQVDEQAVLNFYERNKTSLFRIPPKIKVRNILFEVSEFDSADKVEQALQRAKDAHKELINKPEKFAEFIKKYNGDTIDFFERGTHDVEFEKVAFRLKEKNEVSEIVKTAKGYEIIQLVERIAASTKPLSLVENEIVETIKAKRSLNSLKGEIERTLYNFRTNKNAIADFVKKNKLEKEETGLITEKSALGDSLKNTLAEKIFSDKKRSNSQGSFAYKDKEVLYQLLNVEDSKIPSFGNVESKVREDFYQSSAKSNQKALVKKCKKELLEGSARLGDLSKKFNLNLTKTGLVSLKDDDVAQKSNIKMIGKAFVLNDPLQVLTYKEGDSYYIVRLLEEEKADLQNFAQQRIQILNTELSKNNNLYMEAFIASLMRTAKIEKSRKLTT